MQGTAITPLELPPVELSSWSPRPPWEMRVANMWVKYMPRAKSWFPRHLARWTRCQAKTYIRTANGARLAVDMTNLDVYTTILARQGSWDPEVLTACQAIAEPGQVFYDIGANAGWATIEMAKIFADELTICAFEPQPTLAHAALLSVHLNGFSRVKIYRVMLGREEGDATLYIPAHSIHASAVSRDPRAEAITCPVTTIDLQVASGHLPAPDLVKIDVEGAELDVFRGAQETFRQHPPAIVFESDDNMQRFGYRREDLCRCLQELAAYRFWFIDRGGGFIPADDLEDMTYSNLLALPPGRPLPGQ